MVIVKFTCGHTRELSNAYARDGIGDEEKCETCGSWMLVVHKWKDQWHSGCSVKGCRYGASHGMVKRYAETAAARHTARTGHATHVRFYNDCPSAERPSKREDITNGIATLFDMDIPPF